MFAAPTAKAEKEEELAGPKYSAQIALGVEYDDNIAVEEVDRSSSESDYAMTFKIGAGVQKELSQSAKVSLNYDYNRSVYQELTQVNRQTHLIGGNLNFDLAKVDTGLSVFYINSRLDGQPFLELLRVSPSVSGFLAKKWFARGAYVYSEKTIEDRRDRNANTTAVEGDLYYFRRGLRSYLNIGYRYRDENANDKQFDYISQSMKLRYIQRFDIYSKLAKLEMSWRYEDRDYAGETRSIEEKRSDKRHRWRLDFELPLVSENSAIQFYYGYADYESNLPQAQYNQTITGMRFVHRWK